MHKKTIEYFRTKEDAAKRKESLVAPCPYSETYVSGPYLSSHMFFPDTGQTCWVLDVETYKG